MAQGLAVEHKGQDSFCLDTHRQQLSPNTTAPFWAVSRRFRQVNWAYQDGRQVLLYFRHPLPKGRLALDGDHFRSGRRLCHHRGRYSEDTESEPCLDLDVGYFSKVFGHLLDGVFVYTAPIPIPDMNRGFLVNGGLLSRMTGYGFTRYLRPERLIVE